MGTSAQIYESLVTEISSLDRETMISRLSHFDGDLHLDFTPDYLHACDTERIRHILLAAMWRCRMKRVSTSN